MKLYQDVAGTTPATQPGHPVGLVVSQAGRINHSQPTALSKPTLSRWPKGGVRNIQKGAQAVNDTAYWPISIVTSGVTVTKVGTGVEDGVPFADVKFEGTSVGVTIVALLIVGSSRIPKLEGRISTGRVSGRLLSGSLPTTPGTKGLRVEIVETDSSGSYVGGSSSPSITSTSDTTVSVTYAEGSNPAAINVSGRVIVTVAAGDVINATYRIKGLMWEMGGIRTPFQFNYGPNDITEAGVPDLWHLYNDGGDSLNAVYPAGTYGVGYLSADLVPTFTTVVSDGVTGISSLFTERQADVVIRPGEFTQAEKDKIIESWGRI